MKKEPIVTQKRCVIYTRKSTSDGLDQEFNSLNAQFEACESYIESQKQEGWILLDNRYEDAAISGGTLKRPALQQLLRDIKRNLVDLIVVYKIDRLTRSLLDFSKLVELFEQHDVSFVSVTQQFSSATSMGRLTLNMLLSFSQFEREIAAERIRDKFLASKKKGIFMGGTPPLGYDVKDRKLIINKEEAKLVRLVFQRYIELGGAMKLSEELNDAGYHTKSWTSQTGRFRKGKPFDKGVIYRLLNNRVYLGQVTHKEEYYPGEHKAIIAQSVWDSAHTILKANTRESANKPRVSTPAALKGLIFCGHCSRAMTPTYTNKYRGRQYRYYVCQTASKHSYRSCKIRSVAAGEIENIILNQIKQVVTAPDIIEQIGREIKNRGEPLSEWELVETMQSLGPVWEELFPKEQHRLVQLLISRIEIHSRGVEVHLRKDGMTSLIKEMCVGEC
ncbi:recombinase family protein [Magnetococcales bacterium HHB-1]